MFAFVLPLIAAAALIPAPLDAPPTVKLGAYGQLISTQYTVTDGLPAGEIGKVWYYGKQLQALTKDHAYPFDGKKFQSAPGPLIRPVPPYVPEGLLDPDEKLIWAARNRKDEVWLVTNKRAVRINKGIVSPLDLPREYKPNQPVPHIDTVIRQAVTDRSYNIWLATDQGVYVTDGENWWHPLNRTDGMPFEDVLCLALAPNGDLWGGTTEGAWRLRHGDWSYFWGKRWLPGNRVNAITVGADGIAWLATDAGVARIEERKTTLAEKAAHYEEITQARHKRYGYVTGCGLKVPGDVNGGIMPEASDNDGLWTAIYIGAEAYRYGATRDPKARANAKQSMEALLDLVRLSGYPGYPARAVIHKGETVSGYDPDETVRVPGETDKIWYASPANPDILCKGDTSSDELDGHYFAWMVYYDLVADEKEKEEIRKVTRAVTDNLLTHDYTLIGHTGRKTRWGVFGPQYINDDPRWFDERGINSAELLCYLKVAEHICGDKRFTDAYNDLIDNHHYLINLLNFRKGSPWHAINHSDDELIYLVYYPLLMLEKDPARRTVLVQAVSSTWNGGPQTAGLRTERGPFYSFIYAAGTGGFGQTEEAIHSLQEWPWDLVDWSVRNSHRHDVSFRTAQGIKKSEIDRVLPVSERQLMKWNGNPWEPDGGSAGRWEEDGSAWLLPYWMGRYHKLIAE
jgi:hypothetical protein